MRDFSRYGYASRASTHGQRAFLLLAAIGLLGGYARLAVADSDNPGYDRPGFGFSPAVLDPGDVIVEQGVPDWSLDRQSGVTSSLYSADTLFRLGIGAPLEFQLGTTPWNYLHEYGAGTALRLQGRGDTNAALKLALPSPNKAFSWGLLGSVEFTDGARGLRNDKPQYLLGSALNLQLDEKNAVGGYLQEVRAGRSNSTTIALSDNYALTGQLTAYVETAHLHVAQQGGGIVLGSGIAWALNDHVQLDIGFDRRVVGVITPWQTNLGISVYLGK